MAFNAEICKNINRKADVQTHEYLQQFSGGLQDFFLANSPKFMSEKSLFYTVCFSVYFKIIIQLSKNAKRATTSKVSKWKLA
jgi:hypothetical protein